MTDALTYFGPLVLLAVFTGSVVLLVRRRRTAALDGFVSGLGAFLIAAEATWWVHLALDRSWTPANGLPLQLCDLASVVAGAALWWRRQLLVEITYFWGLAGTLQGLLTPGASNPFPSFWYFQHYVTHGLVVSAALIFVVGYGLWPRPGSVPRLILITLGLALFDGIVDVMTRSDYMYLLRPPPEASLLNLFGPWPWYLGTAGLLALALFFLLDLPFRVLRRAKPSATPRPESRPA